MRTLLLTLAAALSMQLTVAQDQPERGYKGHLSLGLRTTSSLFMHDQQPGIGAGGQFRIGVAKRINTEWFADYIQSNISDLGSRKDAHIGWSVMFYPFKLDGKVVPYAMAGHCFDYTRIHSFAGDVNPGKRWSSATQAGIGTHIPLHDAFDVTVQGQYMVHLGHDIHYHIEGSGNQQALQIGESSGASLEGHLLLTLSMNLYLSELW